MLNSVSMSQTTNMNPFDKLTNKRDYHLAPETIQDIYETHEKNKKSKAKKIGLGAAIGAITTSLIVFAFTKGMPKNTYKYLESIIDRLDNKIAIRKINGENDALTEFYLKAINKLKKFGEKSQSINNFTSYKDIIFMKMMDKTKFTKKIHTKITSVFEKMARNTVNRSYKRTQTKFSNLFELYSNMNKKIVDHTRKVTINGVTKTAAEWVDEINIRQGKIKDGLDKICTPKARQDRYERTLKAVENLEEQVIDRTFSGMDKANTMKQNMEGLKNSPMHQSFIAEDILQPEKTAILNEVNKTRHIIANDITDNYKAATEILNEISVHINPKDRASLDILKQLQAHLTEYKKLSGVTEKEFRAILNKEISKTMKSLTERMAETSEKFKYDTDTISKVSEFTNNVEKSLMQNGEKGEFQEILTIYKALLPNSKYNKVKNNTNSAIKTLDKAMYTENSDFFDKVRDLKLGSAPTDILTILGGLGGAAIGITKAEDKDERISATLTYGIPILGTIATSVALTMSLIGGFKSIAIGLLSGQIMSEIGKKLMI